jgi:hypothetical protein
VRPTVDNSDELSVVVDGEIKISFIYFPFTPLHKLLDIGKIKIFNINDLASNKAYAIGRRGVWRDYVDIFFLLKSGLKLFEIIKETKKRFSGNFDEKLFLQQLIYFDDLGILNVDFIEKKYSIEEIKEFLIEKTRNFSEKDFV